MDTEHISAAYKNGVLELTLPKQAARVRRRAASRSLGNKPQVRQKRKKYARGPPQIRRPTGLL
ncbi:MAG: Hsp20/alpha crystallin family protein [Ruthenibacterium lactatiformans]